MPQLLYVCPSIWQMFADDVVFVNGVIFAMSYTRTITYFGIKHKACHGIVVGATIGVDVFTGGTGNHVSGVISLEPPYVVLAILTGQVRILTVRLLQIRYWSLLN